MTSKISFRRLLREDLKKRMWVAALFGVLFLIIIPLMMLFQIEERLGNAQIIGPDQMQITLEWFQRMMGLDNIIMIAPVMLGAVLSGVSSFSYLHSKSQTDFYHSLPVQRKTWFFVTYAGSVIQVIVPYLLGCLMIGVIGKVKGVAAPGVFRQMPEVIGITVLFFLLLYAVTAVSMLLTGKILTALAGVLVLSFWGSAVYALRIYLMTQAFETYMSEGRYYGFLGNIFGEASWLSPIMAYGKLLDDYRPGSKLKILSVLAVCVLAFSAAAYLLYQFRPSEAAGKAIAFPKAEPVIQVILSVTVGILFGTIVGSQNRSVGMHAGWLFGIGTLAAALSSAVIEFIYHADLKLIFKKRLPLAASVLGTVLVLASVQYDWFGYNTYLPDRGKIRSMAVDSIRVREWTGSTDVQTKGKYKEFLKTLRRDEFDRIYELAQSGMEKIGTDEAGEYVNMAYFLKNGRTVYRSYRVDEKLFMDCISELLEDREYRTRLFSLDEVKEKRWDICEFSDFEQKNCELELTKEQREEFLAAYKEDILSQPVDTFTEGKKIGNLHFTWKPDGFGTEGYYIGKLYREYTATRELMERYKYPAPDTIPVEDVEMITLIEYNIGEQQEEGEAVIYDRTGEKRTEIRDPKEMQKILDRLELDSVYDRCEPNLTAEVAFRDGSIVSYNLRKE